MKTLTWLMTLAMTSGVTETLTFDQSVIGKTPAGWSANAPQPTWKIIKDPSAPTQPYVFAHLPANGAGPATPMAILQEPGCANGEISVKFKPATSGRDQEAGLVWRYRDENNYYVVRVDAKDRNIIMYRVENGKAVPLAPRGRPASDYVVTHHVTPGSWGILKVVFRGPQFAVYYDHRRIVRVDDSHYTGAGKVGLWTRAGSLTYFDNFRLVRR